MTSLISDDRWQRIQTLFYEAIDLETSERAVFLNQACSGDYELRKEIESLLLASETREGVIEGALQEVAAQATMEPPALEKRIGSYKLISVLGHGGMGEVYLAERADELYKQQVAIKLMRMRFKQTRGMLLRFNAERQILANLNHPNIARLLDAGITPDGVPYLVMEYVHGASIGEYCHEKGLSIGERLRLFRTVCTAVEYAHKNLVIHRDIKPANILVTEDGVPKLLDFGIAKLLDPEGKDLRAGAATEHLMTPEYASPEQFRGEPVTTATDVYALGVLLYELLTGKRPFSSATESPFAIARVICEQEPKKPSATVESNSQIVMPDAFRTLKGDLDNIVLMAMRKEPASRYVSVEQFSRDVQAYLDSYPVQASSGTWSYRTKKLVRRNKAAVIVAVAATVALIGFSVGMGLLARRADRQRLIAEQQQFVAEQEAEFLNSIFQAATPDGARGRQITARELLDKNASRIDHELAAVPDAQATMLFNMGKDYVRLGLYPQARTLLERAYELRKQIYGENSLPFAATAHSLASVYENQGEYEKAETLFRQVLAIRQKLVGADSEPSAHSYIALGYCLYQENRDSEAESVLRKSLALDKKLKPSDSSMLRNYLGLVLERKGKLPEAVQLLRESVDIERQTDGEDSPKFAGALHNFGSALISVGDLSEAEKIERKVLDIRRRVLGSDHPETAYPLNNLGWILFVKEDWDQSELFLRESLSIRRKQLGEMHPLVAASINNLARVLEARGNYIIAEDNYRQAMHILQQINQSESWIASDILKNLGQLQLDRGDYSGAERFARQSLEMRRRLGGEDTPDFASSLIDVSVALQFQKDFVAAEPLLRQALDIRKKNFTASHPDVICAQVRLGEVLTEANKPQLAEPLLREAVQSAHTALYPLPSWQVAEADNALGYCLASLGRPAEAEVLFQNSRVGLRFYPQAALKQQQLRRIVQIHQSVKSANAFSITE